MVQLNPINTDPEGAIESVCIKRVMLLKSKIRLFISAKY